MDKEPPEPAQPFSLTQYIRARHPHLFSDSFYDTKYPVTPEVLSYHLETLTYQKAETEFENFARRLCEKFVAPNLRPQTGPTGGGDGKTDAETYPVAKEIALRWSIAEAPQPGERRAFAFSAKKNWRSKIRADVKSIVSTERNYSYIYFVTNQFVPAKDSASVQDKLKTEYNIPVTILDRTWLLDRVFDHDSLDIAVNTLGIGKGDERQVKKIGPKDFERERELEELEKALTDGGKYKTQPYALAEDSWHAALLARELERHPEEVNGRFERALRIAKECGFREHELRVTCDWAWVSCAWYEDYTKTNALYDNIECLALDSYHIEYLERLSEVLGLIRVSVDTGVLSEANAKLKKRTSNLKAALEKHSTNTERPNDALYARAILLMVQISERTIKDQNDSMTDIWKDFQDIIIQSEGLGTFPLKRIANELSMIGSENSEFDKLYDIITDTLAVRNSEGETAKKNIQRAYQKLRNGLTYEAIYRFSRSVHLLAKEEFDNDLNQALIGLAHAYENAGLNWVARNFILAALSQQIFFFKKTLSTNKIDLEILNLYFWLELKLGRIPQILAAHRFGINAGNEQIRTSQDREKLTYILLEHGWMLSALILRTSFDDLKKITRLPDALERLLMPYAQGALLFLMGHEDILRKDGRIPECKTTNECNQLFNGLYALGNEMELPDQPDYALDDTIILKSKILGCDLQMKCAKNLTSLGIGEALLGAMEALLVMSHNNRVSQQLDHFFIDILPSDIEGVVPSLKFSDKFDKLIATVTHSPNLIYNKTREEESSFLTWLEGAAVEIFLKFAVPEDPGKWTEALMSKESPLDQAVIFSNNPTVLANLFEKDKDQHTVIGWIEPDDRDYEIKLTMPWLPPKDTAEIS